MGTWKDYDCLPPDDENDDFNEQGDLKFELTFVRHTEKAICVETFEESFWLPKSQVEVEGVSHDSDFNSLKPNSDIEVYIPKWLAIRNDLL